MTFSNSGKSARALAREYGVSEIHIREMIAMENGTHRGDVVVRQPNQSGRSILGLSRLSALWSALVAMIAIKSKG